jgi:hypothetical protein
MMKKVHSLCFDARAATVEQIKSMFMPQLAHKMCQVALSLWSLIFNLLAALDGWCLLLTVDPINMDLADIFEECERDLGEIGGEIGAGDGSDSDHEPEGDRLPQKRS